MTKDRLFTLEPVDVENSLLLIAIGHFYLILFIGRESKRTYLTDGLEMRDQCKVERVYVLHKV